MKHKKFLFMFVALITTFFMMFSLVGCNLLQEDNSSTGGGSDSTINDDSNDGKGDKSENDDNLPGDENGSETEGENVNKPDDDAGEDNGGDDDNGDDGFKLPENGYDGSEVSITFANTMGRDYVSTLEDAITRFNVLYPNITVTIDNTIRSYDELFNRISMQILTNRQPNLAFCYPDHVALYNQSGTVLALDDFMPNGAFKDITVTNTIGTEIFGLTQEQANDYVETFLAEGSVYGDGKMYTLPFAKATDVMYYNKTFFEKHSDILTEPTDNMSWEEVLDLCKLIKQIDSSCTPLGIDGDANFFITLCNQYDSTYTSATGEHFLFDTPKNREFMEMFRDWYDAGYFTTMEILDMYTSSLFNMQKCYLSISSAASAVYYALDLYSQNSDYEVGIVSIPQANPLKPKSNTQGPSVCIFKKENLQEVCASWLLLKFLTTDAIFQAQYSIASGYVPVIKSAYECDEYKAYLSSANGYATGIAALAASTSLRVCKENAFFTIPAFVGSIKAREQVGLLFLAVIKENKSIEQAFEDAVVLCKKYYN